MNTKEGYNDTENAAFRRYRSYKESIYDYGKFLSENKRYEKDENDSISAERRHTTG